MSDRTLHAIETELCYRSMTLVQEDRSVTRAVTTWRLPRQYSSLNWWAWMLQAQFELLVVGSEHG